MNITIKPLTPDMADDYVRFFSNTPHNENHKENFVGYTGMYERLGFTVYYETEKRYVMRKELK